MLAASRIFAREEGQNHSLWRLSSNPQNQWPSPKAFYQVNVFFGAVEVHLTMTLIKYKFNIKKFKGENFMCT